MNTRHILLLLVTLFALAACSGEQAAQTDAASVPAALVPTAGVAVEPTDAPAPTAVPTAPVPPTAVPASPTPEPTATPAPPTATPDPWAEYAPYTIPALRERKDGQGAIEIVQVLEEAPNFTRYLFAYPSDGLRITGMLNRPRGDGPFPVVVLVHGWYPLDVYQTGNGTKLAADYLANRGFMTLSPDLRSHAGSDDAVNLFRAGHVIDTLNLIPLAQQLPSAQPGKVGLWGHSNGGAIAAKVIAVSGQVAAALIYAPASSTIAEDYQFRIERTQARGNQPPGRRSGVLDTIAVEFPVTPDQAPDLYQRLSPLPYLQGVEAPVQIHWGTADEIVPRNWPVDLLNGLQAAGKPVEYFEYQGQPHSFQGQGNQLYLQRMADFFAQYVQP